MQTTNRLIIKLFLLKPSLNDHLIDQLIILITIKKLIKTFFSLKTFA